MGNVMVIPARRQVGNTVKQSAQKKLANSSKRGHILRTNGALSPFLTVRSTIPLMIVAYFSASRMLMPFISSR